MCTNIYVIRQPNKTLFFLNSLAYSAFHARLPRSCNGSTHIFAAYYCICPKLLVYVVTDSHWVVFLLDRAPTRISIKHVRVLMAVGPLAYHFTHAFYSFRNTEFYPGFREGKKNLIKINCKPLRVRAEVYKCSIPWLLQLHLTFKGDGVGKAASTSSYLQWPVLYSHVTCESTYINVLG